MRTQKAIAEIETLAPDVASTVDDKATDDLDLIKLFDKLFPGLFDDLID